MSGTDDRRAPGATRIPFEALVEVGGALGPSFEAQAVDISEEGMHLRTAYLPEIGQPMTCRFEAGGQTVMASGEVIWKQEAAKGGEFGIRFHELDPQAAEAVAKMMTGQAPPRRGSQPSTSGAVGRGSKVRLHIEGLASPMRAHVKDTRAGKVTAFSGLGFLQVGKHLELEDAATGSKRPARIARVECEVDPESKVPQLVMSFHYEDEEIPIEEEPMRSAQSSETTPEPTVIHDEPKAPAHATRASAKDESEDDEVDRASDEMKGVLARTATKVTPALEKLVGRAKTTIALLAAKHGAASEESAPPARRRTSPPPQGALHSTGRKVVRDSMPAAKEVSAPAIPAKLPLTRRRIAMGAGAAGVLILGAVWLHKPSEPAADPPSSGASANAPAATTTAEAPLAPPPSVLQPVVTMPAAAVPPAMPPAMNEPRQESASNDVLVDDDPSALSSGHTRHRGDRSVGTVAPFSNGPVSHGNVLKLKMDGPIEKIEGDAASAGFTVVLPGRRSLEPAAPLAAHDARIASIRVTNDGAGAELSVAFKDGVPNYLVRAKGDVLEIVLAPSGSSRSAASASNESSAQARPVSTTAPRRHHRRH